ncbi:MAG: transglutaminase family protein [Deltaproteobacteria bacterium]|nr:transglutaminase family protein [Deltaproteobacteria bacterium]
MASRQAASRRTPRHALHHRPAPLCDGPCHARARTGVRLNRREQSETAPGQRADDGSADVRTVDEALRGCGLQALWLGAEPTFTRRESQEPWWLWVAEGGDKENHARALLRDLASEPALGRSPVLVRSVGRQYPGEERPRWSFGLWHLRDGRAAWQGPVDPWQLSSQRPRRPADGDHQQRIWALAEALATELRSDGSQVLAYAAADGSVRAASARPPIAIDPGNSLLARRSVHGGPLPKTGLCDPAAEAGLLVFEITYDLEDNALSLELPALSGVDAFLGVLAAVECATRLLGEEVLILRGFTPPVDPRCAWLTVTPDPGVIEVNLAPARSLGEFEASMGALHRAATRVGLSAVRYRYNGAVTDSGGGGQITFGGPTPRESPFFQHPELLPGLLRYVNRHPALSYAFAMDCVGSASQGPRPDEGVRERFEELSVALDRIAVRPQLQEPETLWQSLAPLLVDASGNAHRAEINIEKLWNPHLALRGQLGLVELRSLGMEPSAERSTAVAALFALVLARLVKAAYREPLRDWGAALHDRFGLPHQLTADLDEVFADLRAHDLAVPTRLEELLRTPRPALARVELPGACLTVTRGLEFWPLMGDVASQEERSARVVDASTARLQLLVETSDKDAPGAISAAGVAIALRPQPGDRFVAGVRYRCFAPAPGLHPGLEPQDPLVVSWSRGDRHATLTLHEWIPGGGAYPGLPTDAADAAARRAARVVTEVGPGAAPPGLPVAQHLRGEFTVDLRRLAPSAHIGDPS